MSLSKKPGEENPRIGIRVKYWEIIAEQPQQSRLELGWVSALDVGLQKVSAEIQMSKPAPQLAENKP